MKRVMVFLGVAVLVVAVVAAWTVVDPAREIALNDSAHHGLYVEAIDAAGNGAKEIIEFKLRRADEPVKVDAEVRVDHAGGVYRIEVRIAGAPAADPRAWVLTPYGGRTPLGTFTLPSYELRNGVGRLADPADAQRTDDGWRLRFSFSEDDVVSPPEQYSVNGLLAADVPVVTGRVRPASD